MGQKLYFTEDIAYILQALRATDQAAEKSSGEQTGYTAGYHDGFGAALVSLALAIGYGPEIKPWREKGPIWIEGLTYG